MEGWGACHEGVGGVGCIMTGVGCSGVCHEKVGWGAL